MENEDLTRLARWVIPGWVAIALLIVFFAIDYEFSPNGRNVFKCLYGNSIRTLSIQDTLSIIALLAALSVPLGFIIYQMYYYLRWNSPFSRYGSTPFLSRYGSTPFFNSPGRMRESNFVLVDFPDVSALYSNSLDMDEWRKEWVEHILFAINHKFRWQYIELLFYDIIFGLSNGRQWLHRYRYRQEILHTLGAASVSVVISFFVYLLAKMSTECLKLPAKGVGYVLASLVVYFVIHWIMNEENETFRDLYEAKANESKRALQDKLRDVICNDGQFRGGFIRKIWGKLCIRCDFENTKPGSIEISKCVFTEFIKIGRFIVPHPTYMATMAMLVIFVMSSSIFIDRQFLVHDTGYAILFIFIISIPLLLWISVYSDYKPTIVPNFVWFATIIAMSAIILYVRYHQHEHSNFLPWLNIFSSIGLQRSGVNSIAGIVPILGFVRKIFGFTHSVVIEEVFKDNGFIINLLVFILVASILSINRSTARLEVISLVRYILDLNLLKKPSEGEG